MRVPENSSSKMRTSSGPIGGAASAAAIAAMAVSARIVESANAYGAARFQVVLRLLELTPSVVASLFQSPLARDMVVSLRISRMEVIRKFARRCLFL